MRFTKRIRWHIGLIYTTFINYKLKLLSQIKINKYFKSRNANQKIKVVFGGHWAKNFGWLILKESEQDITRELKFGNDCIDIIFTEHVIEHLNFIGALKFMEESLRVLKKGGILRIVAPIYEKIKEFDFLEMIVKEGYKEKIETYFENSIIPFAKVEHLKLINMGFKGVYEHPELFFIRGFYTLHNHLFMWSAELLKKILKKIGFEKVNIYEMGESSDNESAIERRRRGIYIGNDYKKELKSKKVFNIDSLAIEAIK